MISRRVVEYGASQLGVSLSADDTANIQSAKDSLIQQAGGQDAFNAYLQENYLTDSLYDYLVSTGYLANDCFTNLYGQDGANLADSDVADYTASDGYLMAEHILILTSTQNSDGTLTPMSDADQAAAYAQITAILQQLNSYTGDNLPGYFSTLMDQYSQDTGLSSYPNGYLFLPQDMMSQFSDATKALQIGQYSDIVKSDYGYHIILRLPIDYDAIPVEYASQGYSLRYLTAMQMFDSVASTWQDAMTVTYSDMYNALNLAALFS